MPWGINSLFIFLRDFEGDSIDDPILNNLPAMITFGVPTYLAVYAYSLGINDRDTSIVLSDQYFKENGNGKRVITYHEFRSWILSLSQDDSMLKRLPLDEYSVDLIKNAIFSRLNEKILINKKYSAIRINIPSKIRITSGEEVIIFPKMYSEGKYIGKIYTLIFEYLATISIDTELFTKLKSVDYIANLSNDKKKMSIEFIV